jgi:O-acetyl-ADP-ribose deacetylase (regulator of RNase III)
MNIDMSSPKERIGNIVDEVKHGIIVQQVNAQGVMGSGVAAAIRARYPKVWEEYSFHIQPKQPDQGISHMGKVMFTKVSQDIIVGGNVLYIANVVGQQFFGRDGKRYTSYDALDIGLAKVAKFAKENGYPIHYPLMGAGFGGGNWSIISSIIDTNFVTMDHTLWKLPQP